MGHPFLCRLMLLEKQVSATAVGFSARDRRGWGHLGWGLVRIGTWGGVGAYLKIKPNYGHTWRGGRWREGQHDSNKNSERCVE